MKESSRKKRHSKGNMDQVPDRQQSAAAPQGSCLRSSGAAIHLNANRVARDPAVDIPPNQPADYHDEGQEQAGPGQTVKLPRAMEKHQVGAHQAGEKVELEPGRPGFPHTGMAAFPDRIQRFREQHEHETQDTQQVAKQRPSRRHLPRPIDYVGIFGSDQAGHFIEQAATRASHNPLLFL